MPIDAITEMHYAMISVSLLVSFMLLMAVILLNLLIAIMSDKHDEVKKQEKSSANYNRAGIVVEYEKLMNDEDRKNPEYSPTYLQVLRPEKVVDDVINSAAEIRVLGQLLHDKTDDIKSEFKSENAELKEKLDAQAAKLDTQAKENTELRKMLETQMQSTSELKDMMIKMMADQDK